MGARPPYVQISYAEAVALEDGERERLFKYVGEEREMWSREMKASHAALKAKRSGR